MTARRGDRCGRPTCHRWGSNVASGPSPTPSCTATPTSASSTARRRRRSWPRRRPASAWRRSALTDHDGFYGVVRFAEAARAGRGAHRVRRRAVARARPARRTGCPIRRAPTCWCWPADPQGYAGSGRRHQRGARLATGGAEKGKPNYDGTPSTRLPRRPLAGAHRLPQGRGAAGARHGPGRPGRRGAGARPAGRARSAATTWRSSCATTATRSTRPRNDALAALAGGRGARRRRHHQRPLRHPGRPPPGHGAGRGARPAQPRRARRLAACVRPAPTCARGDEQARRFARYPGAVETAAALGRGCAFDLRAGGAAAAAVPRADAGSRRDDLAAPARRAGCGGALRAARRRPGAGAYAQLDRELAVIEQLGVPRLLPGRVGHRPASAGAQRDPLPGPGSAANSAVCYALGITAVDADAATGCCSSGSCRPSAHEPPDIDLDIESTAGRRSSSTSTVATAGTTRPRWPTSITYRPKSSVRDMAKALGYAPGQQDAWSKQVDAWGGVGVTAAQQAEPNGGDIPADVLDAGGRGRARPPPPRHPLRRHGDLRPARSSRCARWSGPG